MRKSTSLAAMAALLSAATLLSAPSQAMTPGTASGLKGAAATLDPVETAACWRYGWHGLGWYPCYYGVDPSYGYRYWGLGPRWRYRWDDHRWGWGYHRWGWGHRW